MTVRELREILERYPDDAIVLREDGEYNGSTSYVNEVVHYPEPGWGVLVNSVVIR